MSTFLLSYFSTNSSEIVMRYLLNDVQIIEYITSFSKIICVFANYSQP